MDMFDTVASGILIVLCCAFIALGVTAHLQTARINEAISRLDALGITVEKNVEIESPSIIKIIKDYEAFSEIVKEIKPKTVYLSHGYFYVFTSDYQIAYRYFVWFKEAFYGL